MGPVDGGEDGPGAESGVVVFEQVVFDAFADHIPKYLLIFGLPLGISTFVGLREVAPFPEKDRRGIQVAGDDLNVGHDHAGQFLLDQQVFLGDGVDRFKEIVRTPVGEVCVRVSVS